jgi:hypothetical protein
MFVELTDYDALKAELLELRAKVGEPITDLLPIATDSVVGPEPSAPNTQ